MNDLFDLLKYINVFFIIFATISQIISIKNLIF